MEALQQRWQLASLWVLPCSLVLLRVYCSTCKGEDDRWKERLSQRGQMVVSVHLPSSLIPHLITEILNASNSHCTEFSLTEPQMSI